MNCTGWYEMQRNAGWGAVLIRRSKKKKEKKKEDSTVHAIAILPCICRGILASGASVLAWVLEAFSTVVCMAHTAQN